MARPKLKVEKRKVSGRKVKKLRAEGLLPANVFGRKVKSITVQLSAREFRPIYSEVGETGLVDLVIEDEKKVRPVLIHNIQVHPVTSELLHVDFHQVDLTQKVKASIPVEIIGEAPAVEQKLGIMVRLMDVVEVEALPADLPEKIEVDISGLVAVGDMVKVGEMKIDEKISLAVDAEEPLVKIEPPTKAEEEKPTEAETGESEGEQAGDEVSAGEESQSETGSVKDESAEPGGEK